MEHSYIEEHNIADRYLSGKLSAEERMRFEEHFVDCTRCLDQLETTDDLRAGLKTIASEEALQARANLQIGVAGAAGLLARVARLSRARRAALLAGLILAIALPMALLTLEWSSARRELAQAKQTSSELQRKYEEGEQAARDLINDIQSREQLSSVQRDLLAAQLERERAERSRLADQVNKAADSQAALPVFALSLARSGEADLSQPVNLITFSSSSRSIILLLELDPNPDLQSYRATISTADGRSIWSRSGLKPSSPDALALSLNTSLLKPNNYLLTLEGLAAGGRYVSVAKYTFRAQAQ
jgi:Putative zinc-finger